MASPLNYASPNTAPARSRFRTGCLIALTLPVLALGAIYWFFVAEFNRFPITIVVMNDSAAPVRSVEIHLDGRTWSVASVAAGATLRKDVSLRGRGTLKFTVINQDGSKFTGTAADYLDADSRGYRVGIRVIPGGASTFDPQ